MSLVFAAITPHPLFLIPNIGKEQIAAVEATKKAMEILEQDLYASKPQVLIIISPHGSLFNDSFSINAHPHLVSSFEKFGDLTTKKEWLGATDLAAKISHKAKESDTPIQLVSLEQIDHGASVPLYYLTNHLPDIKILPVGYSGLDRESQIKFGTLLKEIIMSGDKRIAVIASGDLAHSKTSAEDKKARQFEEELIQSLKMKDVDRLKNISPDLVDNVKECGYRSSLIIMGILKNVNCKFKLLAYEYPFGVGYLTGEFLI